MYRAMRFPSGLGKALTLSYDDGVREDKRLIEIMIKNGLKGTFNINSGIFAPEGNNESRGRMRKDEAYELYLKSGMEVAVHTFMHPNLPFLTDAEVMYELNEDKLSIEKETNRIIRGMAYPYGTYSDSVVECLQAAGFLYARTVQSSHSFGISKDWLRLPATCHHNDKELMNLAHRFADMEVVREPQMFYLWGHSYEFENNNNWNIIEEFSEIMGNRSDIWYATNIEIFEYMEAYDQLIVSADGKTLFNPTAVTLYFKVLSGEYSIKPGETLKL